MPNFAAGNFAKGLLPVDEEKALTGGEIAGPLSDWREGRNSTSISSKPQARAAMTGTSGGLSALCDSTSLGV
jgi:hypothetical protein